MLAFTIEAFDDIIVGTSTTWYTSASLNERLGSAGGLGMHATTTNVAGTTVLSCQVEHSGNAKDWVAAGTAPQISGVTVKNEDTVEGALNFNQPVLLTFARVRISLTGTNPQCRLKLHITGRGSTPRQVPQSLQGLPRVR